MLAEAVWQGRVDDVIAAFRSDCPHKLTWTRRGGIFPPTFSRGEGNLPVLASGALQSLPSAPPAHPEGSGKIPTFWA